MRSPKIFAVVLAIVLTACGQDGPVLPPASHGADGALQARSAATCENVRGTLSGSAFEVWGLTFEGDISGPGTLLAEPQLDPRGQGAIHLATLHAINTSEGMITTTDQGVLAPVDPPVYRLINRYTISGGTDAYADATGFMRINALIDISTGELEGTYHGRVCR